MEAMFSLGILSNSCPAKRLPLLFWTSVSFKWQLMSAKTTEWRQLLKVTFQETRISTILINGWRKTKRKWTQVEIWMAIGNTEKNTNISICILINQLYLYMYECIYVFTHAYTYIYIYVCVCVCVCVYVFVSVRMYTFTYTHLSSRL